MNYRELVVCFSYLFILILAFRGCKSVALVYASEVTGGRL